MHVTKLHVKVQQVKVGRFHVTWYTYSYIAISPLHTNEQHLSLPNYGQ